jgi:hypothetical protein
MARHTLRNGLVIAAVALLTAGWAAAGVIEPGVNHMKTQPESFWDFSVLPIDEEHFGPGSDPFDNPVAVYTHTSVWHGANLAITDTVSLLPVELVAMQLHSVHPIEVTYEGGTYARLFDVVVTPEPGGPNAGFYRVTHDPTGVSPDHGVILADGDDDLPPEVPPDSFFDVTFRFDFFPQVPELPGETYRYVAEDRVALVDDVPWCAAAPAPYGHDGAGGFFPGFGPPPFGDPPVPQPLVFQGQFFSWQVRLEPVPEPTTLTLLALGGLALVRRRRRG